MSNKKNTGSFGGKGYYIALILCAAAIGISGYLYYQNANENEPIVQNPTEDIGALRPSEGDIQVIATQPTLPDATEGTQPSPTENTGKKPLQTGMPVSGQTVMAYAMDSLCYNPTTRDWRTHNGIDIAAEAGTPVLAAAEGTVQSVLTDKAMGTTVTISHSEGYVTVYASLGNEVSVAVGDSVSLGQPIGTVANTALLESALGDHLHFSVSRDTIAVDPMIFLSLG